MKWVTGFFERHGAVASREGEPTWSCADRSVTLRAADGAIAVLEPFAAGAPGGAVGSNGPTVTGAPTGAREVEGLAAWASPPAAIALVLVRRGGYGVGLGKGPELVSHKVGTRYVQSRTAAGGWSQHRFARRRDNQADALVVSVIEHARRVVLASPTDALVVGGDKSLVHDVLADPRLTRLTRLPRRELFDLPDPKLVVLKQALRRGRAVRIVVSEPDHRVVEPQSPSATGGRRRTDGSDPG